MWCRQFTSQKTAVGALSVSDRHAMLARNRRHSGLSFPTMSVRVTPSRTTPLVSEQILLHTNSGRPSSSAITVYSLGLMYEVLNAEPLKRETRGIPIVATYEPLQSCLREAASIALHMSDSIISISSISSSNSDTHEIRPPWSLKCLCWNLENCELPEK